MLKGLLHTYLPRIAVVAFMGLLASLKGVSQISWNNSVPAELEVCQTGKTASINFTNQTGNTLSNVSLNMQLPQGITYVTGSLSESSAFNVQELSVSNPENVTFSIDDVPDGQSISFDVTIEAGFDALAWLDAGNVFRNTLILYYNTTSDTAQTSAYNILYPALTITDFSPSTAYVYVGQTFTRTVTIVNGGYGSLSSFVLKDTYDSNYLDLIATDKGSLNSSTGEITFSSADFTTIGDGDGLFEQNESITVTETITVVGCSSTQSTLQAFWGCDGQTRGSNKKYPYTSVSLYPPNLAISATPSFNTCLPGTADVQQLTITNNGTGPANNVSVTISQLGTDPYSRIDEASIQYSIDGSSYNSLTPTSTSTTYAHSCLGSNPIGSFTVTLPDNIQPGSTVTLKWDSYTCSTIPCSDIDLLGWKYSLSYTDMCGSNSYSDSGKGQHLEEKGFTIFAESPSDLSDGQTGLYNYIISSAAFDLPEGTNPYFELVFDLPTGLMYNGNTGDLKFFNGTTEWTASSVSYNTSTNQLIATYDLPIPFSTLQRSEIQLKLTLDCTQASDGSATVGMTLNYVMDSSCPDDSKIPLTCLETATTYLHCPGICTEGLVFESFTVTRTSVGEPDNDQDGLPDSAGTLDTDKIKLNRIMVSDTFKTIFSGTIKTSSSYPSWSYAYATSYVPYGDYITALYANVQITKAATNSVYTCSLVPISTSLSGGTLTVDFDLSPASLVAAGCSNFSGLVLEEGDQIVLTAYYKVSSNPGGMIDQATITNDFYVSPTANGTAYQCNDWNGNFTLIGYYWLNYTGRNYNIKTCTRNIEQGFYLSIGDCCTNYGGGDYFPYEYRNWGYTKQVRVVIPDGYDYVSATMIQYRTKYTNATVTESASITPTTINGQEYIFDLSAYYVANGGSINYSDDGFHGKIKVEVDPECTASTSQLPMYWYFKFQEADRLGGNLTAEYSSSPDYLKYKPASVTVSPSQTTQEGTGITVSWDINVQNSTSSDAPNAWIFPIAPNGAMNISEVFDLSTNTTLSAQNGGFYQLGQIDKNSSKSYRITATFNSCAADSLKIYSGYGCDGYPTNLTIWPCPYDSTYLYVEPQPTQLQMRFLSAAPVDSSCSSRIELEGELLSSKLGTVTDIMIYATMPERSGSPTITIESGSTQVKYPLSNSYASRPDPTQSSNVFVYNTEQIDSTVAQTGLPGITNTSANQLRMKFIINLESGFEPGQTIRFDIASKRACGDSLPTLAIEFDLNAVFTQISGVGMDHTYDNWAAAWGDYNNDGYVDLFVTTRDENQPNQLYKNNGDGTFSLVTSGNIATDVASSLAAAWGDYDNDGDLDLFVANNIGYGNFLYRNNGDGTFTSIQNDPAVNDKDYAHGAAWADYDNDGDLDLFVAEYFPTKFNHLYRNNGDGTFTAVTDNAIILEASFSTAGAWGDYNNDGLIDLFVCNTNDQDNSLYKNIGGGRFLKINAGDIVNDGGNSVGASWGDYDNDGDLDLFVANSGDQDNFLYRNNGDGTFTKVTSGDIVNDGGHSHGSAWADYDNDGDLDLYVANNGGYNNFLYANNGDGTFTRVYGPLTDQGGESMGVAWVDYDNDLDYDLFVANRADEANFLFANSRGQCYSKACIVLDGNISNNNGIGAIIKVKANIYGTDTWQMRQVSSQTGGGIGGQSDMKTLIGLGDATIIDSLVVIWPSGYTQVLTNMAVDECQTITEPNGSKVCGVVYYDKNGNCTQDTDEPGIRDVLISMQPGDLSIYTDSTGSYEIYLAPDTYTVSVTAPTNWNRTCTTDSYTITVSQLGSTYCGNDFALTAACPYPDLEVEVASTSHRIGFENLMAVQYANVGTDTAIDVTLTLTLDSNIVIKEATTTWDSYANDRIVWSFAAIPPGTRNTIYLTDSISTNTAANQQLSATANITTTNGNDCNSANNSYTETALAVGAIDPNDILVWPEGPIRRDEVLTYKIRFQNVGNTLVKYVRIEDELPIGLEPETLVLGLASHPFTFHMEGQKLVWEFPNINMPDSTTNEPESHGFVLFQVQPRQDIEEGALIENSALIFFDNQAPIRTNTVTNVIVEQAPAASEFKQLSVMPNPATDIVIVRLVPKELHIPDQMATLELFNAYGLKVQSFQSIGSDSKEIDCRRLPPGMYYLRALGKSGTWYSGKVLIQ